MSQLEVQFDGWNYILVGSFRMGMSGGKCLPWHGSFYRRRHQFMDAASRIARDAGMKD